MSWHQILRILFLSFHFIYPASVFAKSGPWTHYGVRPLAMGNAYVAVADDFNSLFYNPAGLARLDAWDGEFLNPRVAISKDTLSFVNDAMKLSGGASNSTDQVFELIENNTGKNHYMSVALTPHLIFQNFGFGIGTDVAANMVFHRHVSVDIDVGPRVVFPIAFALNFLEDRLSLGYGIKLRVRGGVNHSFSIEDVEALRKGSSSESKSQIENYVKGGYGIGHDFGLLFTPVKTSTNHG